jgi:hypothetical protein
MFLEECIGLWVGVERKAGRLRRNPHADSRLYWQPCHHHHHGEANTHHPRGGSAVEGPTVHSSFDARTGTWKNGLLEGCMRDLGEPFRCGCVWLELWVSPPVARDPILMIGGTTLIGLQIHSQGKV